MSDKKQEDLVYNKYLNEVVMFFNCYNQIAIYQFAPTILYLPVYQVLNDIRKNPLLNKQTKIKLEDIEYNDIGTSYNLLNSERHFINKQGNKELFLGLSEYTGDQKYVHKFTLIERVPIWGLALKNNKKINLIKKTKKNIGQITSYWELFGSKFSLLDIDDFNEQIITVSLYPVGSTVYRIFNEDFLGNKNNSKFNHTILAPHSIHEASEFDDLFSGATDITLTLNPTYAIRRAQEEAVEIEVVFNYYGHPKEFTHIFMRKYDEFAVDRIIKKFILYLKYLVYYKIKKFYNYNKSEEYDKNSELYCNILQELINEKKPSCRNLSMLSMTSCEEKDVCKLPSRIAQQVCNDSRIYSYDLEHEIHKDKENILSQDIILWEFMSNQAESLFKKANPEYIYDFNDDPVELFSKWFYNYPGDNHGSELLTEEVKINIYEIYFKCGVNCEYIEYLLSIYSCMDVINKRSKVYIKHLIDILLDEHVMVSINYKNAINKKYSYNRNELKDPDEPNPDDKQKTGMCIERKILTDLFSHFRSNSLRYNNCCVVISYFDGLLIPKKESSINDNTKVLLILIKYNWTGNKGNPRDGDFIKCKKEHDNDNVMQIYRMRGIMLNSWYISEGNVDQVFQTRNHGKILYQDNSVIYFDLNNKRHSVCSCNSTDEEVWVFTFTVLN